MKVILKDNNWLYTNHGWGNGYVLIPEGHPLHGKPYDDIEVDVHGGLTFSELVDEDMINHWGEKLLSKEDIGGWLVGFDTAHYSDNMCNWPKEAVQAEANRLRDQLILHS